MLIGGFYSFLAIPIAAVFISVMYLPFADEYSISDECFTTQ